MAHHPFLNSLVLGGSPSFVDNIETIAVDIVIFNVNALGTTFEVLVLLTEVVNNEVLLLILLRPPAVPTHAVGFGITADKVLFVDIVNDVSDHMHTHGFKHPRLSVMATKCWWWWNDRWWWQR